MQKIHVNLISFNDVIKDSFISNISERGIVFLIGDAEFPVNIVNGKWQTIDDVSVKNRIEELFTQLTFIDVKDPILQDSANYSFSNMLDVIYAMINLHNKRTENEDLINSKKRLEKSWNAFARKDRSGKP
jgi:hypothetical protein